MICDNEKSHDFGQKKKSSDKISEPFDNIIN